MPILRWSRHPPTTNQPHQPKHWTWKPSGNLHQHHKHLLNSLASCSTQFWHQLDEIHAMCTQSAIMHKKVSTAHWAFSHIYIRTEPFNSSIPISSLLSRLRSEITSYSLIAAIAALTSAYSRSIWMPKDTNYGDGGGAQCCGHVGPQPVFILTSKHHYSLLLAKPTVMVMI